MTDTSPPILETRGLRKTYRMGPDRVEVLRGVDLEVHQGEWLCILGASGSGKSTLLHLLGGLDRPDRGARKAPDHCKACGYALRGLPDDGATCPECGKLHDRADRQAILYDGRELSRRSARELNRYRNREVGFVFQFYHLLPELRVIENVTVGAMIRAGRFGYRGAAKREAHRTAVELLDAFGLGDRLRHRPSQLSGGERQRVAIARALVNRPKVLLADEPTGNLDRRTGESIIDTLETTRERLGLTVVMVTHDEHIAARAGRVIRLRDGVVQAAAPAVAG